MEKLKKVSNISWTMLGDSLVILDTRGKRQFHELNEIGAFLWNALDEEKTSEELKDCLLAHYDVSEKMARNDIETFLLELKKKNLLQ